jgi:ADP-ribose pyrophosphatase
MDYTETLSETLELRKGLITNTRLDRVNLPNGETSLREVVEHPGGVAIIPVDEDGFVYCVRQFRYPFQEHLIELPAGKLEYGEDPLDCAVRELSEETGIQAREFVSLGKLYPSPGYCRETLYIYMAAGLAHGEAHLDQNEFLDVMRIHIDELVRMVLDNELSDAKTALGILKAKALLDKK